MSLELEKHVECTYYIYACVHEYTYYMLSLKLRSKAVSTFDNNVHR